MSCEESRVLLHGYVDRELDLAHSLEIERHLQTCAGCTQEYTNLRALRGALSDGSLSYAVPEGLERRIQMAVRRTEKADRPSFAVTRLSRLAAAAVVLFALVWGGYRFAFLPRANENLAQEVVASHVRSLMAAHLEDVISTDQHTVKPWFAGKLDFSPPVVDPAAQGYPLIGGRLDYLAGRPVAALVYRHRKHVINVFVWPSASDTNSPARVESHQGYQVVHWTQAGMTEWAVSDMNGTDLQTFAHLLQQ